MDKVREILQSPYLRIGKPRQIDQAHSALKSLILGAVPKEMRYRRKDGVNGCVLEDFLYRYDDNIEKVVGYNQALTDTHKALNKIFEEGR